MKALMTTTEVTDKEFEQIEKLWRIVQEGSQCTRDFMDAYRAERRKEDERRRRPKPN